MAEWRITPYHQSLQSRVVQRGDRVDLYSLEFEVHSPSIVVFTLILLILSGSTVAAREATLEEAVRLREEAQAPCEEGLHSEDPDPLRTRALKLFERAVAILEELTPADDQERQALERELTSLNALIFWTRRTLPIPAEIGDAPGATSGDEDRERNDTDVHFWYE